jgi:hypothetical protein
MRATLRIAFGLQLMALLPLAAQQPGVLVRGDTAGAPPGCSASEAIAAITSFAAAMNAADSVALARVWSIEPGDRVSFTQAGFAGEEPVLARSLSELVARARRQAQHGESLMVQAVTFNGWHDRLLAFGPLYVRRSATDQGGTPRYATGQGAYVCGRGLVKIGWGPRIELKPGQRMIPSQAYPPDVP